VAAILVKSWLVSSPGTGGSSLPKPPAEGNGFLLGSGGEPSEGGGLLVGCGSRAGLVVESAGLVRSVSPDISGMIDCFCSSKAAGLLFSALASLALCNSLSASVSSILSLAFLTRDGTAGEGLGTGATGLGSAD